jgi:hypothetical protein
MAGSTRLGIWSFAAATAESQLLLACFWAIRRQQPVVQLTVDITEPNGGTTTHVVGYSACTPWSFANTVATALDSLADVPVRLRRDIPLKASDDNSDAPTTHPYPSTATMLASATQRFGRWTHRATASFGRSDYWNVGVLPRPIESLRDKPDLHDVVWWPERSRHRFPADPFMVRIGDDDAVLAEDYDERAHRGVIRAFSANGTPKDVLLDQEPHVSYPFTFTWDGETYCLPESSRSGRNTLWRLGNDGQLVEVADLLPGVPLVDATICWYDDRWWLFASLADRQPLQKLYVWHASSPTGPWEPHAANPVKIDPRDSRPGGTMFTHRGRLVRPSQDCSVTYGGALSLTEIRALSTTEFDEAHVGQVQPSANSRYDRGCHTVSPLGADRTLVDGKRVHFTRHALSRGRVRVSRRRQAG